MAIIPPAYRIHSLILAVLLLCFGFGLWFLRYAAPAKQALDKPLENMLANIPSITAYSQYIDTRAQFPDRTLRIVGSYDVDIKNKRFAAYSTTTLFIKGDPKGHIFSLKNIAIGDDVYTKVETKDPLLRSSITYTPQWLHFKNNAIPKSFTGIAVPGPIEDNLQVFKDNGAYLSLVGKGGSERWGKEPLLKYTFKLSGHIPTEDGPLSALISRVGPAGSIDLWVDPATFEPRYMVLKNDSYVSTTTIQGINSPLPIVPPIEAKN